ncbi:MFS transporter [Ehrlichia ruminantium]|uniref:MFS transporter n=1 Tax=Ehrlichia ruminantium TaxID=779 RepID=A0AAE6UIC8_EHRRU|nr:MFS transporter [Ehrlichia ruminantium]QGR02973.1 MFS transporter [Ehrlichia ruminantium]QGR03280.1 MFS transporter [Ehrlichia ruminantium]QGR04206.1 MFS transporter [Ehrlichia ruminantium]
MLKFSNIKPTVSVLICAFIECYDFMIYGNFSRIFGKIFFSHLTEEFAVVLSFMTFAIAFIVRPFGSLLFGYIGDKFGRKIALFSSATLLIISIGGITFLPQVELIGILSPILLIVFRVLQGLSFAGEVGCIVLMTENVKNNRNIAFSMGGHFLISILGGAVGCFIFKFCYYFIPETQFYSWGWRIPFFVGLIMSISLPFLRNSIQESRQYLEYKQQQKISKVPILDVILHYKKPCLATALSIPFCNSLFYMFFVFLGIQQKVSMAIYVLLILTILISGVIFAMICVVYKPTTVALSSQICFVVLMSPIIYFLGFDSYITYFIIAFSLGMCSTPIFALLMLLFPVNVRQTGLSISYSIAIGCCGAITPMMFLWLSDILQLTMAPIFCINFYAIISLYSFYYLKTHEKVIEYESVYR